MRSRVMVRKVDRLPAHFPIFEDLATPILLMNKLEPDAKITRIVANASTTKKIEDSLYERKLLESFVVSQENSDPGRVFFADGKPRQPPDLCK